MCSVLHFTPPAPAKQVDVQGDELTSVLPVEIFLSFPLLNFLSYVVFSYFYPFLHFPNCCLDVITVPHPLTALSFPFSPSPSSGCAVLTAAVLPVEGFCAEAQPGFCRVLIATHSPGTATAEPFPVFSWCCMVATKQHGCGAAECWHICSSVAGRNLDQQQHTQLSLKG